MRKSIFFILYFTSVSVIAESNNVGDLAKLDSVNKQAGQGIQTEVPYPNVDVIEVFNVFLRAVDRGQLILFDESLSREVVMPTRVEYIYTAELPYPIVTVYSELKKPMPIPSMPDVNIIGISGVMDLSGNIVETTAHCDINN